MSDDNDDTTSEESSEDEPVDDPFGQGFFKTLSCLKNKDPAIYDDNVRFFSDEPSAEGSCSKSSKSEQMYLRDYNRKMLLDELKEPKEPLSYVQEQTLLKQNLKSFVDDDSDDDELLSKVEKTDKQMKEEEEDYISWLKGKENEDIDQSEGKDLKPLRDYWNDPNLDKGEAFLKDYILNQRWKEEGDKFQDSDLSEDGDLLEAQENYERDYNFKGEEEMNLEIKRFPRTIGGSARRKDDSRKQKRTEIKERKRKEKEKKMMEVKQAQKEKLQEIKEKIEMLKKATGNETLGFDDDEIIGDFDSEQHDKMMESMYGAEFYSKEDEAKPDLSDDEVVVTRSKKKKERKRKKSKKLDLTDIVKPGDENFKKAADEFYSLEGEDFIDDILCRYKYKEVVPNSYGLTVEEILAADDSDLNKWMPLSKLYRQMPPHVEKNEVKIYQNRATDLKLKAKLLPSLFKTEDNSGDETEGMEIETKLTAEGMEQAGNKKKSKKHKKKNKPTMQNSPSTINDEVMSNSKTDNEDLTKKNKQNNKKSKLNSVKRSKFKNKNKPLDNISDQRLLAYEINPRKFWSKLKYGSNNS